MIEVQQGLLLVRVFLACRRLPCLIMCQQALSSVPGCGSDKEHTPLSSIMRALIQPWGPTLWHYLTLITSQKAYVQIAMVVASTFGSPAEFWFPHKQLIPQVSLFPPLPLRSFLLHPQTSISLTPYISLCPSLEVKTMPSLLLTLEYGTASQISPTPWPWNS